MKALIVKQPWIDYLLSGEKTWEIRGSNTHIRGDILLIQSKTGLIIGKVTLVDSIALSKELFFASTDKHKIEHRIGMPYKNTHAWVLTNPIRFDKPIAYNHPKGAIVWVNIDDVT